MGKWNRALANLFLPNNCIYCQAPVWGQNLTLCTQCLDMIETVPQIYNEIYREKIDPCYLDKVFIAFSYDSILQELLEKLKYEGQKVIGNYLGQLSYAMLKEELPQEFNLVPVPLHQKKYKQRGFNQTEVIADGLRRGINASRINLLKRVKDTPTQTKLTREERKENVKNAFEINDYYQDKMKHEKPIVLLDDVLTSGATMNEAAHELKKNGYANVYGIAVSTPIIKDFY